VVRLVLAIRWDFAASGHPARKGSEMATFIMLSTLTDDGASTIKENPERIKAVNEELSAMGVKVLSQYAVLGPYDFVNIVEAPDTKTVTRASVELSSRGSVRLLTMPAIPIDEFIAGLTG
jgi:uncharacterized protein with GYD domain